MINYIYVDSIFSILSGRLFDYVFPTPHTALDHLILRSTIYTHLRKFFSQSPGGRFL